jgi:hypothetical protein
VHNSQQAGSLRVNLDGFANVAPLDTDLRALINGNEVNILHRIDQLEHVAESGLNKLQSQPKSSFTLDDLRRVIDEI